MNFESPEFNSKEISSNNKEPLKKKGLKNTLQKAVAFGAISLAALTGEGCAPEKGETAHSGKKQSAEAGYDPVLDPNRGFYKIDQREFGMHLSGYFSSIESDKVPTDDESRARVRDLIQKSGFLANANAAKDTFALFKGGVPVEIKVDGKTITGLAEMYTEAEKWVIENNK